MKTEKKTIQKMLYKYNLKQSAVWFWLSTFEESGNKMEWQQIKNKMRKKAKTNIIYTNGDLFMCLSPASCVKGKKKSQCDSVGFGKSVML